MIPFLVIIQLWLNDRQIPIAFNRVIVSKNITMKTIKAPPVKIENCNFQ